jgi:hypothetical protein
MRRKDETTTVTSPSGFCSICVSAPTCLDCPRRYSHILAEHHHDSSISKRSPIRSHTQPQGLVFINLRLHIIYTPLQCLHQVLDTGVLFRFDARPEPSIAVLSYISREDHVSFLLFTAHTSCYNQIAINGHGGLPMGRNGVEVNVTQKTNPSRSRPEALG